MTNIFAPFGFATSNRLGAAPSYQISPRLVLSTNTTAIFAGDPISNATGTTGLGTGYIQQAAVPVTITPTALSWSAGVLTVTFSTTTAPPVGAMVVASGFTTATGINGTQGPILASTTTTFTFQFPVTQSTDTSGTFVVYQPISGIFLGVEYYSTALKKTVWSPYWPGTTDPATNGTARVIDDPQMVFRVQGNGKATQAMVGQNTTFAYGSTGITLPAGTATVGNGNTTTGLSTACADIAGSTVAPGAGPYLPFTIVNLISDPPGVNGTDTTSNYNWVYATFNAQMFRSGTSGI